MEIRANTRIDIDRHTVLAEMATAAKRPELRSLCQAILAENDQATTAALRRSLPNQQITINPNTKFAENIRVEISERGLANLLQLLADLGLTAHGRLTQAGRDLCDDPDSIVPIPEYGAYQLGTFNHPACGLQVHSLRRLGTPEMRGTSLRSLEAQATYDIDPLHVLKANTWFETVEKSQKVKFVKYAGGQPVCIQNPTASGYLCITLSASSAKDTTWQLASGPRQESATKPVPTHLLETKKSLIIDSILAHATVGKWDGQFVAAEFDAISPEDRKVFSSTFTLSDMDIDGVGFVEEAQCHDVPLRPSSQDTATRWIKELALGINLGGPTTRSQFLQIAEEKLGAFEDRFVGYRALIPPNGLLAQSLLAANKPAGVSHYWNLQSPIDLLPSTISEPDAEIDLFAPGKASNHGIRHSTGLTIEHHQLLEYEDLLAALQDGLEAPAELLVCDRHMFAPPQANQLPRLLSVIKSKWPNCHIHLWYSDSKSVDNRPELFKECEELGCKIKVIPRSLSDGKIHDRFILLRIPHRPPVVWGASNTLLGAKLVNDRLRWPQVNLTKMKPEQAHTEIRNWAK